MYTIDNFKTKRALREAVAAGRAIGVFQPGPFGGNEPTEGEVSVEGPHFPEPHRWYARVRLAGGRIVGVR